MMNFETGVGCGKNDLGCSSRDCEYAPDFCIKRGDSKPSFKVSVEDCEGVVDLTDENLVLEASMWFNAKVKSQMSASSTILSFADNIGFDQISVGDIIIANRPRSPERMLVTSIDETAKTIQVQRGYSSTTPHDLPKGMSLQVFKFQNHPAEIQSFFDEIQGLDGTSSEQLSETFMVFNWEPQHTALSGCYWLEFKLLMMDGPSVSWTKKTPSSRDGFLIKIVDSPSTN